jgi:hypothetical protein
VPQYAGRVGLLLGRSVDAARTSVDVMEGDAERSFDPQKLVVAVNECFEGFHFSVQTLRPEISYADRVKAWFEAWAAAENRGVPFNDPQPILSYRGSATFDHCEGEERESGFVLKLWMKAESSRSFELFIEEEDMVPEVSHGQGPNVESSIAAQLAFWTEEMICHGTVDELDGRAVGSGKWLNTWT